MSPRDGDADAPRSRAADSAFPRRFRLTTRDRLDGHVDEEARLAAVPGHFMTKGMYLADLLGRLDDAGRTAVIPKLGSLPRHGTYQPFLDYPLRDALVLLHAVARKLHPRAPLLEGLRLLGRATVKVFLESQAGRVVRTMVRDPRDALLKLPGIWKKTDPQSVVVADEPEPGAVRLRIEGFPSWIDCGVVGTIEQVVMNHGCEPELDVHLASPMSGEFVVRWRARHEG